MGVLAFDRRQRGTFTKTFEQYVSTRVGPGRINGGRAMLQRHAALLSSIEAKYGVPRQILVAIWGLESDFGKGDMGKLPVFRVLATMAHDCRRTELFQGELLAALKILQRGDLSLREMIGAYAGEIGQTQFLPSSYIKYGVDFDGDGRIDLRHSVADVLASTANLLHSNGFKMGAPYGEGSANFEAMREWNRAVIYRKTIAYYADQLHRKIRPQAGAVKFSPLRHLLDAFRHDLPVGGGAEALQDVHESGVAADQDARLVLLDAPDDPQRRILGGRLRDDVKPLDRLRSRVRCRQCPSRCVNYARCWS